MEKTTKNLKTSSLIVLLFAGLSLLQIISELMFGELNSTPLPEGAPENTLMITKIVILVVTLVFLIPKLYVGLKGLRVAKNPNTSKGHIIWAMIIFGFAVLDLIEPAMGLISGNASGNFSALASITLELVVYFEYIKHARAVAKQAAEPSNV